MTVQQHLNALMAEVKAAQNILKQSPDRYIVVVDGTMLRGAYDRNHVSVLRFQSDPDPEKGPFSPIQASCVNVTTHAQADAVRFAKLVGGTIVAIGGVEFKVYIKSLKEAIGLANFRFTGGAI